MQPIELEASIDYGGTKKAYIARILGTDPKFGLRREFVASRKSTSKSGRTGHVSAQIMDPGVYERASSGGDKRYNVIVDFEGALKNIPVREATAYEIVRELENGRAFADLAPVRGEDGKLYVRTEGLEGPISWRGSDAPPSAPTDPKARAIEQIRALMREHGITAAELAP